MDILDILNSRPPECSTGFSVGKTSGESRPPLRHYSGLTFRETSNYPEVGEFLCGKIPLGLAVFTVVSDDGYTLSLQSTSVDATMGQYHKLFRTITFGSEEATDVRYIHSMSVAAAKRHNVKLSERPTGVEQTFFKTTKFLGHTMKPLVEWSRTSTQDATTAASHALGALTYATQSADRQVRMYDLATQNLYGTPYKPIGP